MLFIGDGCGFHIPADVVNNSSTNVFFKSNEASRWGGDGATRCTDSYIIHKNCAYKILNYFKNEKNISLPIDWWLNKAIRELKLTIFWAEPTIITQGTQNGTYTSSH